MHACSLDEIRRRKENHGTLTDRTSEGLVVGEEVRLKVELLKEALQCVHAGACRGVAHLTHPLTQQLLEVLHITEFVPFPKIILENSLKTNLAKQFEPTELCCLISLLGQQLQAGVTLAHSKRKLKGRTMPELEFAHTTSSRAHLIGTINCDCACLGEGGCKCGDEVVRFHVVHAQTVDAHLLQHICNLFQRRCDFCRTLLSIRLRFEKNSPK
jgi:hypothetical protein